MTQSKEPETAPAFVEQTWDLEYRHSVGETVGRFLAGLRQKKLLGRRCGECSRVLFPARSFCDRCHVPTADWVEVSHRGTIEMFTIVYEDFPRAAVKPPYVLAYALLEGADTAVAGYVKGLDLSAVQGAYKALRTGTPVDVAFTALPEGRVTDFWFEVSPTVG